MKTVIVSKALRREEALVFIDKMRDLFEGKLKPAKRSYDNGWGKHYPMYYVVREIKKSLDNGSQEH